MSDQSHDRSRRRFLTTACTVAGCIGLGGHLLGPRDSSIAPHRTAPEREKAYDPATARAAFQRIETAGFPAREAMYWEKTRDGLIRCTLCPTFCTLRAYERGRCRVRFGLENRLVTVVHGKPCSVAVDPVEKKPVFHLVPGSFAFSLATAGCLLNCRYCQNWQISQANPEEVERIDLPPAQVVEAALRENCRSIAYTYTEPTIFYEYMLETARLARQQNLYNIMVSCGYINPEPLAELLPHLDVFKVDLKGFTDRFYRTVCGGRLEPVLAAIAQAAGTSVLVDIVTLVVPTLNDDPATLRAMFAWLAANAGPRATLFLSRFHPTFQLRNLPPTPLATMEQAREDALAAGLPYVYLGNVAGHRGESTWCPSCKRELINRIGYQIMANHLVEGCCPDCQTAIPGIWK